MIVADASAVIEALVADAPHPELLDLLSGDVHAPALLDIEVMSVLRGLSLGRRLDPDDAERALEQFVSLTITRYDFGPLRERCWSLRHQMTTYDATYVALAEALDAPLVTCDAKLDRADHRATVLTFARSS